MKKYTIGEIKKWGESLPWEDGRLVYSLVNNPNEEDIDEANGYLPNTHTENEQILSSTSIEGCGTCYPKY